MIRCCAILLIATACLSTTITASAQDQSQLDQAARLTFESGREAFVAGDYERALRLFRQAYDLSQRPGLLYNIAQTLDRLRRDAETLQALRQYVEAFPDAPNRAEVDARIRVLQATVDDEAQRRAEEEARRREQERQQQQAATATTTTATTTSSGGGGGIGILHPAIIISVAGVALVGGGLSVWAGLETIALNDTYLENNDPATVAQDFDEAESMQTLANIFIFTSAGLGLAAVVLAILTDWDAFGGGGSDSAALRPSVAVGSSGGVLGLEGSF